MATARLRRTFRYPADSDDDDAVEEGMDEQDQETLISNLSSQDTTNTRLYTQILLLLPLTPILLYIPRLLSPATILSSLAAVVSLLCSAYILYFLPLPPVTPSISPDSASHGTSKGKSISRDASGRRSDQAAIFSSPQSRHVPYLTDEATEVLRKYSIPANAALCAILAVVEMARGRTWGEGMTIGGGYIPGFVLVFILWARRELRVVDLGELERLRYRTKGR